MYKRQDVQIRSYQATLGQQETIELTREKWLSLTNGPVSYTHLGPV